MACKSFWAGAAAGTAAVPTLSGLGLFTTFLFLWIVNSQGIGDNVYRQPLAGLGIVAVAEGITDLFQLSNHVVARVHHHQPIINRDTFQLGGTGAPFWRSFDSLMGKKERKTGWSPGILVSFWSGKSRATRAADMLIEGAAAAAVVDEQEAAGLQVMLQSFDFLVGEFRVAMAGQVQERYAASRDSL